MLVNRNIVRYQQHNVTYLINSHVAALLHRVLALYCQVYYYRVPGVQGQDGCAGRVADDDDDVMMMKVRHYKYCTIIYSTVQCR
jgi:hypothetical protein